MNTFTLLFKEHAEKKCSINNIRTLLDWKLLSTTVTICVSCLIMMEDLRENYKSALQDIFDSEN